VAVKKAGAVKRKRARLDVDERREQLIALGLEMFGKKSYDDVSIDDVAKSAGISKGLLYHYFPTKRHFYLAGLREAARRLLAATFVESEAPPDARLRDGLDAYLAYVEDHAPAFLALFRGGVGADKQIARVVDECRQEFVERLLVDTPGATDSKLVRTAVRGWVGMVEAASIDWIAGSGVTRARLGEHLAHMLVATIASASK
jgi:AcrR family transcriptional regulator